MAKRKGPQVMVTRVEPDGPSAQVVTYLDGDGNEQRFSNAGTDVKVGDKVELHRETR